MTDSNTPIEGSETDTMDQMIQRASVPNLAGLFKQAKDAGLIGATTGYGEQA